MIMYLLREMTIIFVTREQYMSFISSGRLFYCQI